MKNKEERKTEQPLSRQEADVLIALQREGFINQRLLAESTGHSLGVVNRSLRSLAEAGYLDAERRPTDSARRLLDAGAPRNAVILAAGFGMRMVPISFAAPKALLEVKGERLIDRTIRQLHEAGVTDVTVVVGFMKDSFEYLMDEYGVDLVFNPDYAARNNLFSLARVRERLANTYVIPGDIWCRGNPYRTNELYSWYMVSDRADGESDVRVNRKGELVRTAEREAGSAMVGIAYLSAADAVAVRENMDRLTADGRHDDAFWEAALYDGDRMLLGARLVSAAEVVEINTYEQLRDLDADSSQLRSGAIGTIARALACREEEICEIAVMKKGMTNRSFRFTVRGQRYIMRIPGEGTDRLIDRRQEAEVFRTISGLDLCDDPVYMDPDSGFKITRFLDGARVCDPRDEGDLRRCMEKLRAFHALRLTVGHGFDIFGQIEFYEKLWAGEPSVYRDYRRTKAEVFGLKSYIDRAEKDWCLTHIDAVPDNFLFYPTPTGEALQLTDWEYAGMQDPHVDIAMFCIYSLYRKEECDRLIDLYFDGACSGPTRTKIYCYIAACGLLWSNWCEYKRSLGAEFGEYSLRQYRYAKEFCRHAKTRMEQEALQR